MIVLYKCICPRNYAEWRAGTAGNANAGRQIAIKAGSEAASKSVTAVEDFAATAAHPNLYAQVTIKERRNECVRLMDSF